MREKLTLSLMFVAILGCIGVWDLFCLFSQRPNDTVSSVVRESAQQWPVIAFAAGMLIGHLFWS
jgi:hypothetical protein